MRVLVCGSRTFADELLLCHDIETNIVALLLDGLASNGECHNSDDDEAMVLIEGGAAGADRLAANWHAEQEPESWCGCSVQHRPFPANWRAFGRAAGGIRNTEMLVDGKPDIVLAFIDKPLDESRGTHNMVKQARKAGVPTYIIQKAA